MQIALFMDRYAKAPDNKIANKRQWIISEFVDEINKERPCSYFDSKGKKKTLPKITARAVAVKLGHLSEFDMTYFLSECRDYRHRKGSFSKRFFGSLKPLA